jgi:hypothetical protein
LGKASGETKIAVKENKEGTSAFSSTWSNFLFFKLENPDQATDVKTKGK